MWLRSREIKRCLWWGAESGSAQLPHSVEVMGSAGVAGRSYQPWRFFPAAREEEFLDSGACKEASQGVLAALAKVSDWCNNIPEFLEENTWEGERRGLGWVAGGFWVQPWGGEASVAAQHLCSGAVTVYLLSLQKHSSKSVMSYAFK